MSAPVGPWYPPEGTVATEDANGVSLGYAGPDGSTLYYRGYAVLTVAEWDAIRVEQEKERAAVREGVRLESYGTIHNGVVTMHKVGG